MSEDTTNAFVAFFSKIAGKDYWIFWVAISIASWVGFFVSDSLNFFLIGIATAIVIILIIITKIYRRYKTIQRIKALKHRKIEEDRIKHELAIKNEKTQKVNRENLIWRFIAYINDTDKMIATCILNYPIHDEDKYTRFIRNPKLPNDDEGQLYHAIWSIVNKFRFVWDGGIHKLYLLERQQIREGFYVTIDPYLYEILEQYKNTHKWAKISTT